MTIHEKNKGTALIGQTLRHFNSLHERILLGKRLYSILFSDRRRLEKIVYWATSVPHTGSRIDYWPHLFKDLKQTVPGFLYKLRIKNCQLRPGIPPIYSPRLTYAWKDVDQKDAETGDWFKDWNVIEYLSEQNNDVNGEIMGEYCETLEKIELGHFR